MFVSTNFPTSNFERIFLFYGFSGSTGSSFSLFVILADFWFCQMSRIWKIVISKRRMTYLIELPLLLHRNVSSIKTLIFKSWQSSLNEQSSFKKDTLVKKRTFQRYWRRDIQEEGDKSAIWDLLLDFEASFFSRSANGVKSKQPCSTRAPQFWNNHWRGNYCNLWSMLKRI